MLSSTWMYLSHQTPRQAHVSAKVKRRRQCGMSIVACKDCFRRMANEGGLRRPRLIEMQASKKDKESEPHWDPMSSEDSTESESNRSQLEISKNAEEQSLGVSFALSFLKFYKGNISPLLPMACRYLPTCSEYAMTSYQKFGVGKGTVLTTWRLARCNPFGGKGYDPPKWPPPGLEWPVEVLEQEYVAEAVLILFSAIGAFWVVEHGPYCLPGLSCAL